MPTNEEIANHLQQIAHLFLKAKEQYRSKAFSKVADGIRFRQLPITILDGKIQEKIEGVGESINETIVQFITTGTSDKMEKLRALLPNEVVDRFEASVCKRKVTELLQPLTDATVDWGFAGSMRRGLKTVKDVDVIICLSPDERERAMVKKLLKDAGLAADIRDGDEKVGVSIPIKSQGRAFALDLNFTTPAKRGAHYLYFTGPRSFNIEQRQRAKNLGLLLNQKGLFRDEVCVAGKTEEEIFAALGEKYLEPAERS
jgi:DNA polymerase/3'-5' exonuclease PolX